MEYDITPKKVQEAVHRGYRRLRNFRNSRLMFLRNYTGQYYDKEAGDIGTESMNLIFNAIRALVPHIVMSFPTHKLTTPYLPQRQYGDLLSMAMGQNDKKIDIKTSYRRVITDAIFTVGCMKTGIATSETIYALDDIDRVDSGTIYATPVDFDNLIVDPKSKEHLFADAAFIGDRMTVSRKLLLDSGLFKNDLVERLPRAGSRSEDKARQLSMKQINEDDNFALEDDVEIVELWVPSAKATVYLPADEGIDFDDYLRIDDYYGVNEGPYTFLALTPPVPGNPIPVPSVGIWNDLHVLANRMAKKIVDQAMRQKDVVVYKRSAADDAQELLDAADGETVASDDPDGVQVKSYGGQQNSNEAALMQLQNWFNLMAGNPDQLSGTRQVAGTATQEKILSGNASIGLDDAKDLVYAFAAAEGRKRAWYIDTDPLMNIPLVRRVQQPPTMFPGTAGMMTQPGQMVDQQVILTPELRSGDFLDFTFEIEPESMGRKDSGTRFAQAMDFMVKVMPSIATTAQTFLMMGLPFSAKACVLRMAKLAGIDWLDEVFADPEFQMQMMQMMAMGPQQSKGQLGQNPQPNGGLLGGGGGVGMGEIQQNGQPGNVMGGQPGLMEQMMSDFQQPAVESQQFVKRGY